MNYGEALAIVVLAGVLTFVLRAIINAYFNCKE